MGGKASKKKGAKISTERLVETSLDLSPPSPVVARLPAEDASVDSTVDAPKPDSSGTEELVNPWDVIKVFKERVLSSGVLQKVPGMPNAENEEYLACIVQSMKVEYWGESAGASLIMEEGRLAHKLYVVVDGIVNLVVQSGEQGWPQECGKRKQYEFFGEESLERNSDNTNFKENARYSYSAVASQENIDGVTLLCLDVLKNRRLLESDANEVVKEARAKKSSEAVAKAAKKLSQVRQPASPDNEVVTP